MKRLGWLSAAFLFTGGASFAATPSPAPVPAATPPQSAAPATPPVLTSEQASYDFGVTFGQQLRQASVNEQIKMDMLTKGLREGLAGKKIEPPEQQAMKRYVMSVRDAAATRNRQAAHEFLAKNGQQKGIVTTPSGLQYRIVTPGDTVGPSPQPVDQVTVQYRGKLLDGTEFDSSYSRSQPTTLQASRVIRGWQEALVLMKPGAKWQLFVPPELAYDLNSPPGIPPGSLLIFDIELVRIDSPPPAANPKMELPPKPVTSKKPAN